jgi:FHS family L-fucose permease-like MFS transporter
MIDAGTIIGNIPSVKTSFLLPLVCFVVVALYGFRSQHTYKI